jgi:hypothetical protein
MPQSFLRKHQSHHDLFLTRKPENGNQKTLPDIPSAINVSRACSSDYSRQRFRR